MTILEHYLQDATKPAGDWDYLRLVADWAAENDKPHEAECLRWMIRQRKRPYLDASGTGTWFNEETVGVGLGEPESDIPAQLYILLEGGTVIANHKTYTSAGEAERALLTAWRNARDNGWRPAN